MTAHARAAAPAWLAWLRRYERALSVAWLGLVALALLALALPPSRRYVLGHLEGLSDRWDLRWDRRLAHGEQLVAAKRFREAVPFLERLERDWPAPSAEHRRDTGHEQILRLLARSYEGLGKNQLTMKTYDRLIAFDRNNYDSPFLKGEAARRLLSGWAIAPEARDGYAAALKLFPVHLPSLRGYIDYYSDRGEWHPIVDAYQAYLDAFLLAPVRVALRDTVLGAGLPTDGRMHAIEFDLPHPADSVTIFPGSFITALDSISAGGGLRVGSAARANAVPVPLTAMRPEGLQGAAPNVWRPVSDSTAMHLALPAGTTHLRLVMRSFKPMDRALWTIVALSYHNLVNDTGRVAAEARTALFEKDDQADAALAHPWWARAGLPGATP